MSLLPPPLALGVLLLLLSFPRAHRDGGSFAGVTPPPPLAAALAPEPPALPRPLGWGTDSILTGRGASPSSYLLELRARASRGGLGAGRVSWQIQRVEMIVRYDTRGGEVR